MSQELINATLKPGVTDGITLYKDQSVSIDLRNYVDLKFITGESIPYPYTGSPITESAGILIGKTPSQISASARTTVILNTDGSLAGFGYIKDDYYNINTSYNKPTEINVRGTSGIGKIIKIKKAVIDLYTNPADLFALTDDNKFLSIHEEEVILETDVLDFAVTHETEYIASDSGGTEVNHLIVVQTTNSLKVSMNGYFSDIQSHRMEAISGKTITQLEGYSKKVFALCSDNTIFAINSVANAAWKWEAVTLNGSLTGKTVSRLVGGTDRIFAICTDGTIAGLGNNTHGKLGNGNAIGQTVWAAVSLTGALSGKNITDVSVGIDHTLFLCSDGTVVAVGGNSNGQLGNGSVSSSVTPVKVYSGGYLSGKTPIAISAGGYHSAVITNDGSVYTWGSDSHGQLGNGGNNKNSAIPTPVSMFEFTKYINHVQFSCADLPDGLFFDGNLIETARIIGIPTTTGTANALIKIDLSDFTFYNPIPDSGNIYEKLGTGYVTLPITVLQPTPPPPPPPPTPPTIIRNGNLLMDVGVAQNIKVTFNPVYQTIYTRVTGLPPGMRYTGSPDGFVSSFISGTPLVSGTYNITIATSYKTSEISETINTTKAVVYTVYEAVEPAILLSNQNLTVGTSVNIKLRASDVSTILAWSATGLPAGLVCGTGASAAITGTPTTVGTFNSTITLSCLKIKSTETTTVTKPVTFTVT